MNQLVNLLYGPCVAGGSRASRENHSSGAESPGIQHLPRVIIRAQMLSHLRQESWRAARGYLREAEIRQIIFLVLPPSKRSVFPPKSQFYFYKPQFEFAGSFLRINASVFSIPTQYSNSKKSPQASPWLFLSILLSLPSTLFAAREGSKKDVHLLVREGAAFPSITSPLGVLNATLSLRGMAEEQDLAGGRVSPKVGGALSGRNLILPDTPCSGSPSSLTRGRKGPREGERLDPVRSAGKRWPLGTLKGARETGSQTAQVRACREDPQRARPAPEYRKLIPAHTTSLEGTRKPSGEAL